MQVILTYHIGTIPFIPIVGHNPFQMRDGAVRKEKLTFWSLLRLCVCELGYLTVCWGMTIATRVWNTPIPRRRATPEGETLATRKISRPAASRTATLHEEDDLSASENERSEYVPMKELSPYLENRFGHTAVLWEGTMWIFGGQISTTGTSTVLSNTIIAYNIEKNEWWSVNPTSSSALPTPRKGHSAIVYNDTMLIFGGCGASSEAYNDMWVYSFESNTWAEVRTTHGQQPPPRYTHASEILDSNWYIYGGQDGSKDLSDFHVYDLKTSSWYQVELSGETPVKPQAKQGGRLIAFEGRLVLIGGSNPVDDYSLDLYVFSPKKGAWFLQRYEMEVEEPQQEGSPPSSDVMASRYSRSESLMTADKRNRIFHSATLVTVPSMPSQCEIFVFGGVNQILANVLDEISLEFSQELPNSGVGELEDDGSLNRLPQDMWEAAAMFYNPEVLALADRMRMLTGEVSYARDPEANTGKTQAMSTLKSADILMLIMEWLSLNGYRTTLQRLVRDTRHPFIGRHYTTTGSALELLLSFARRRINRGTSIWDDQVLSLATANGEVQSIDHLPDWYSSQSKDIISFQNPWDEPITDDNLRVDPGSHRILFATLNTLVILTLDYSNFVNCIATVEEIDDYLSCLFHTYHSFTAPTVLLEKFIQLFQISESSSLPGEALTAHRMRCLDMLLVWIDLASWDWTNEYLVQKLKDFVDGPLMNTELRFMGPQIKQALSIALDFTNSPASGSSSSSVIANVGKVKSQSITTKQLMSMSPLPGTQRLRGMIMEQLMEPPEPIVRKNIFSSHHTLDDVHEIELARQLTIVQFSLFCMIKPSELLNGWWKSEDAEYRSPHVRVCMNRSSLLTDWVLLAINKPREDKKTKERTVERFFKLAEQLRNLNNFETLSAILAGLRQVQEEYMERIDRRVLESLYQLDTSISKHNEAIDHLDVLTPCIPNLSLLLKQIAKVEDEAELLVVPPTKLGRPLVNMHKCRSLYQILRRTITLQSRFYNFLPVYQIISLLRNPSASADDAAATASLRIMLSPRVQ